MSNAAWKEISETTVLLLACKTFALISAMIVMKSPIPADTALLSESGIASNIASRTFTTDNKRNITPSTNTAASATCHETPRPNTTE